MNNQKKLSATLCLLLVVAVLAILTLGQYNGLIRARNEIREQKAQIENVLQARIEKIPDLVASVKNYAKHEETIFKEVSEARANVQSAINDNDLQKMADSNEQLTTALAKLVAVVEAYPELQSSKLYIGLNDEIAGATNRIAQERRVYNQKVREYNNKVETYPTRIYARMFGFESEKYFEATSESHTINVVDFGD